MSCMQYGVLMVEKPQTKVQLDAVNGSPLAIDDRHATAGALWVVIRVHRQLEGVRALKLSLRLHLHLHMDHIAGSPATHAPAAACCSACGVCA